jgi:hypothetical protein
VPKWWNAPDREASEGVRFVGRRAAHANFAEKCREERDVNPVSAADERQARLWAILAVSYEHKALDDLTNLRADRASRVLCGVSRLIEYDDLERHALSGGSIEHTL